MQMIDVLKRLAELDKGNPNVVNPMVAEEVKEEVITEGKEIKLPELPEPGLADLKALSGVKQLNESTIAECGMMPMGAPMPPTLPASLNMSAGNASEIVAMMRGIMDLAKGDTPTQTAMPTMGASMKDLLTAEPPLDGGHDEPDADNMGGPSDMDADNMDAPVDDSGADELADIVRKIKTGEPVKIKTDMPVKVTSDEPIKGSTTDKLNARSDDEEGDEDESYDNSPKPETKGTGGGDDFANIINKVRTADLEPTPFGSGSNPMPNKEEKKEEAFANAFEAKLMAEYQKFVQEGKDEFAPGKNFEKISKAAGGGEKGDRIAGAVRAAKIKKAGGVKYAK